jgi:hypothetical protein
MAFEVRTLNLPPSNLTPAQAPGHLVDFLLWVSEFFEQVAGETGKNGALSSLFVPSLITYLPDALVELHDDEIFRSAIQVVEERNALTIRQHGLYGFQLRWKLSNINYWLAAFTANPVRRLLDRLLDAIDALLESILDGVPGGSAIIEMKEAIRNAAGIEDELG